MASHSCPETFQLVGTLRQVSPDGDSLTPSGWTVMGHLPAADRVLARVATCGGPSPSRYIHLERKKECCRLPPSRKRIHFEAGLLLYPDHLSDMVDKPSTCTRHDLH